MSDPAIHMEARDHDGFGLNQSKAMNVINSSKLERDSDGKPVSPFPHSALEDPAERPIFTTRLVPHRSLTRRNFHILMMVFAAASCFSTLPFVLLGAWPVAGFMGLDVVLFYLAFRANFRAARAYEDVNLTPIELQVAKVSQRGIKAEWRFHPSWVRLHKEEHEEFGVQRLALVSRGQSIEIGHFLGPDEKAKFAAHLSAALAEARRGPRFS